MKKSIYFVVKWCISACIALTVLSAFSMVYYNPPIAQPQPEGLTNSKSVPDKKWSYMLEGAGHGTMDSYGYNNSYFRDLSNPDVVFLGSSHLASVEVPEKSNCIYLLKNKNDDVFSDT